MSKSRTIRERKIALRRTANFVKKTRKGLGLRPIEFCKRFKISYNNLYRYEHELSMPQADFILDLLESQNISQLLR